MPDDVFRLLAALTDVGLAVESAVLAALIGLARPAHGRQRLRRVALVYLVFYGLTVAAGAAFHMASAETVKPYFGKLTVLLWAITIMVAWWVWAAIWLSLRGQRVVAVLAGIQVLVLAAVVLQRPSGDSATTVAILWANGLPPSLLLLAGFAWAWRRGTIARAGYGVAGQALKIAAPLLSQLVGGPVEAQLAALHVLNGIALWLSFIPIWRLVALPSAVGGGSAAERRDLRAAHGEEARWL